MSLAVSLHHVFRLSGVWQARFVFYSSRGMGFLDGSGYLFFWTLVLGIYWGDLFYHMPKGGGSEVPHIEERYDQKLWMTH